MTDLISTLAAADPARDATPTATEAARMDDELRQLLVAETSVGAAGDARVGAAGETPLGAAGDARRRVGAAGETPVGAAGAARRRLSLPRRAWVLAPVALATAAVSLGVALPGGKTPAVLQPAPASAATTLAELQRKVAGAPAEHGRYAYLKQLSYVSHMHSKYVVVLPHESEQWVADDGSGVVRTAIHEDQPQFPTPEDQAAYERDTREAPPWDDTPRRQADISVLGLTVAQVRALPTDPAALRERIERKDVSMTATAGALLSFAGTPQDVKVALFEVLEGVPGAKLVPRVEDPLGRVGVGVAFDDPAWNTQFVFDPKTGALLGTRSIGKKEVPGRTIDDWNLVVDSGRTDTAPEGVSTNSATAPKAVR